MGKEQQTQFTEKVKLKQFLQAGSLVLLTQVLTGLSWLILIILFSRHLNSADVGIILFFHSLSIFLGILITLGTGTAALRFVSERRGSDDYSGAAQVVTRALVLMLILTAIFLCLVAMMAAAGLSSVLLRFPGLPDWGSHAAIWVSAVAIRMNAFDLLIAQDRPGRAALHSGFGAAAIMAGVLLVGLAASIEITLGRVLTVATASAVLSAISAQVNALWCARHDAQGPASGAGLGFGDLLRVGVPIVLSKASSSRRKEILVVVLGAVASSEAVALLGVTNQVLQIIAMPMVAVTALIQPQIAQAGLAEKLAENMPRIRTLWSVALLPVTIISLFAAFLAEPLAVLAYGPDYAAVGVLVVVSIAGQLITVVAGPAPHTLMMTGHERALAVFSIFELFPLVLLCLVLGSQFGALGGAWAFSISVSIMAIIYAIYIKVRLGFWVFSWVFPARIYN